MSDAQNNPKIKINSISITGYASPEGEENSNNTLSTDRANTGKIASIDLAKKVKNDAVQKEIYTLLGKGEDYEGFKVELQKSTMNQDEKQLVIRVLEMYKDPIQRETEMRNMAKTFTYLDEKVFPKLRRAEIKVSYETTGHSDDTYQMIAKTTPEKLNVEELLYAASLAKETSEKTLIYNACETLYPNDYRAFNNVGVLLYLQGKFSEAETKFEKANAINSNPITLGNLGAVAGNKGDFKKAKELLSKSMGSAETNYNNGIIAIIEGNYTSAISNFTDNKTFNKALAQVLNKEYDEAITTIEASQDNNSAQGNYLKAIIASRTVKTDDAINLLKNAIAKDASFKSKAQKDREFLKLNANQAFLDLVK